jgi:hypothetical protein
MGRGEQLGRRLPEERDLVDDGLASAGVADGVQVHATRVLLVGDKLSAHMQVEQDAAR